MKDVLKYSVGIDVGSKELHVCVGSWSSTQVFKIKGTKRFANDEGGMKSFWQWHQNHLGKEIPVVYVMEATGVYHENLCNFLYDKHCHVSVVVPSQSKSYAKSLGINTKTDKVDSKVLSQMGGERSLKAWQPFSPELRQLRTLTRHYESLQVLKNQVKNQIHGHNSSSNESKLLEKQQKDMLKLIEKQLIELKKNIEKLVKEDELLNQKWVYVAPIDGIGLLTFAIIAAETNGFALFQNERQLTKYAGYDVIENQSGKHKGKTTISKRGNAHIRRALHLPAFSAVKKVDSIFFLLYQRVFDKTKIKMKGYVAVQRKLLIIIFHLWKKNEAYQLNFPNKTFDIVEPIALLSVPDA